MTAILTQGESTQDNRTGDHHHRTDRRLLVGYLHKTSNTLCGIKGYASLIADRGHNEDEAGHWARKIIREVERMEEIFRSVGDLTRRRGNPDTGLDLPRYVRETSCTWADNLEGLDLSLGSIPDGELRLPAADLALVLHEILNNCSESVTPRAEIVRVEITGRVLADDRIFLVVTDNGCGMSGELAGQATDPFVTTKDDHHGVGLTRVDTLMGMYGLEWNLESEEGQGTRVLLEVAELV